MNEHSSAIAVIRMRLPYLERGALSQAWFDALHLAGGPSPDDRPASAAAGIAVNAPASSARRSPSTPVQPEPSLSAQPARRAAQTAANPAVPAASRARRARPIARTGVPRRPPATELPRASHFTLTLDGSRVQILVRRSGARFDLVALCSAARIDAVRRALAGLDRDLRAAGTNANSHVRTLVPA